MHIATAREVGTTQSITLFRAVKTSYGSDVLAIHPVHHLEKGGGAFAWQTRAGEPAALHLGSGTLPSSSGFETLGFFDRVAALSGVEGITST